jgi:hypothetical protein
MEYHQYDYRQPSVIAFVVSHALDALINDPRLDGTFVDVIDAWLSAGQCSSWGCTTQELVSAWCSSSECFMYRNTRVYLCEPRVCCLVVLLTFLEVITTFLTSIRRQTSQRVHWRRWRPC